MLTKNTKKKAEEMANKLAPLFKKGDLLFKKYQKAHKIAYTCRLVAHCWQWLDKWDAESLNIDIKEIEELKANDPKKWHEILYSKYAEQTNAETSEDVAKINVVNYLNYLARLFAALVAPYWREFKDNRGFESLAELINEKINKTSLKTYIARDGGAISTPTDSPNYYIYLSFNIWASCGSGIEGNYWRSFKDDQFKDEPQEPKAITEKEYYKAMLKIKELERKAKAIREEQRQLAEKWGLVGHVELIKWIETTK